jgi:hypothetical protein
MTGPDQGDPKKLYRRGDPATSAEAAHAVAPNLAGMKLECLCLIRQYPDSTQRELDEYSALRGKQRGVSRRCSELVGLGYAYVSGRRKCRYSTRRTCNTYRETPQTERRDHDHEGEKGKGPQGKG